MLTKLAFKNAQKSFKDYAIYFLTLIFGVCVFYMFNSIEAQQGIMEVTEIRHAAMRSLTRVLSYISIFVSVVLGFLIIYANNFFIKRRKKELGIYLTLGMDKRKISTILLLETSLIAVIALILGLVLGVFLSQFMSVFTAKIFEADLTAFKFVFSPVAVVKSILYFGLIFITVMIFNTIAISKYKLIDLIYGGRKNETLKLKSIKISFVLFIFSIVCLGASYVLIIKNGMLDLNWMFSGSIILGIIGTVLFFFSLTGFLIKLIQKNEKLYFKDLNMFVLRQLNSKINTNFVSMSVVCIVLLLTIGTFATGLSMENVLSDSLRKSVPFHFTFLGYDKAQRTIIDNIPKHLGSDKYVKEYDEYNQYIKNGLEYKDILKGISEEKKYLAKSPLRFITLTDYNEILEMQDKKSLKINVNSYIIVSNDEAIIPQLQEVIDNHTVLEIEGQKLQPQGELQRVIVSDGLGGTIFVIEDSFVSNMKIESVIANLNCISDEAATDLDRQLSIYTKSTDYKEWPFRYYTSKAKIYEGSITAKAIVSFLAIYLGIVFLITSAAILALQQLSEATDNKQRYELLSQLGVDERMINKALFIQIACYFLLPLSLAVVHSAVGLSVVNNLIQAVGKVNILGNIFITAIFIVAIYGTYFGATYIGSKNIVNK